MSKTLTNILKVFKVAKIVAKVVFILCIVGAAGSLLGLTFLPMAEKIISLQPEVAAETDFALAYSGCVVGLVSCIGEAIFAFLAGRYFKKVLDAGTPFTFDGAKASFRLGVASIIISVASSIVAGIAVGIVLLFSESMADYDTTTTFSLTTGLFFMFLSMIFKYGAELSPAPAEEETQEAGESATERSSETEVL